MFLTQLTRIILIAILWGYACSQLYSQSIDLYIQDGKFVFIRENDSLLIEEQFDYAIEFCDQCELTVIGKGTYYQETYLKDYPDIFFKGEFGLINREGKVIESPVYDMFLEIGEDYVILGEGDGKLRFEKWPEVSDIHFNGVSGVVNTEGDTVVPFIMTHIKNQKIGGDNYWIVNPSDREGWALLNHKGRVLTSEMFDEIGNYTEGFFKVKKEEGYGYIDTTGMILIPPIYTRISDFDKGMASVQLGEEYFMLYESGAKAINYEFRFDTIYEYIEGFAKIKAFNQFGFIDPNGDFLATPKFTSAWNFYHGISGIEMDSTFGYLYKDGTLDHVIKYEYDKLDTSLFTIRTSFLNTTSIDLDPIIESYYFFPQLYNWDFKNLVLIVSEALRWAPYKYYHFTHMLPKVAAGEGSLSARYLFNQSFWTPGNPKWERFKQNVLFPLLKSERSRIELWEWVTPVVEKSWISMPDLHRQTYLHMFDYLEKYYGTYRKDKVSAFLRDSEPEFAYYHFDGTSSPYRKCSALIDRLILVYDVIDEQVALSWIRKINSEIRSWESSPRNRNVD